LPTTREQLLQLLDKQEVRVRRAFVLFVKSIRSQEVMDQLVARLEAHDLDGAFKIIESHIARFGNVIPDVVNAVGVAAAAELDEGLKDVALAIVFDPTNPRASALVSTERARLIRQFTDQQFAATQQAISRAVANGAGPAEMARAFRDSIGLTINQEGYVNSYRQQLQALDSAALGRALRDRRFDGRIGTAIGRDRPLTQNQIETMVDRYRARAIMARAETVARTEALTAYSQAREEALQQMMDQTRLNDTGRVVRVWFATHDDRVRAWHLDMDGQKRPPGEPFTDGLGNSLMFPGDPTAPPETRINCRCTTAFEVLPPA
jgi:hypothetical protein